MVITGVGGRSCRTIVIGSSGCAVFSLRHYVIDEGTMAGRPGSLPEYRDSSLILLHLLVFNAYFRVSVFTWQFLN